VIYGNDDRQELYTLSEYSALARSAQAVAAVIPRSRLELDAQGARRIVAQTLGKAEELCDGEPHAEQPSAAECTAVLVDDNLLATSGHCFRHLLDCGNYHFVFGYAYDDAARPQAMGPLEVYECTRARVQENEVSAEGRVLDYAIVELTRSVSGRAPVALRTSPLALGESLTIFSTPGGIPLKVDSGARVLDTRVDGGDYFQLDSDTFHGSSGAPVLDAAGALVGLFARGNEDYVWDEERGCHALARRPAAVLGSPEIDAEQASYAAPAVSALCAKQYPSERLCGIAAQCGDGICFPGETHATCSADCKDEPDRSPDAGADVDLLPEPEPPFTGESQGGGCTVARQRLHTPGWAALLLASGFAARRLLRASSSHRNAS
jgi:hypothetical protein